MNSHSKDTVSGLLAAISVSCAPKVFQIWKKAQRLAMKPALHPDPRVLQKTTLIFHTKSS
jgi:hypothetical protein